MGTFSWACRSCELSILHPNVIKKKNAWMNHAVALFGDGSIIIGKYDGYGRIEMASGGEVQLPGGGFAIHHFQCWEKRGRPVFFMPSNTAKDQGYFISAVLYDKAEPE